MGAVENLFVVREWRSRMRGNRAVWLLFGYVLALSTTVLLAWLVATEGSRELRAGWLGRDLFVSLAVVQGLLLALVAPAFAAGSFSLEREQESLDSLLVTPCPTLAIVVGKLLAATLFALLLLTASVPLLAFCLLFGGVAPAEIGGTYCVQFATALLLAALGLGWSLHCRSTSVAVCLTYTTVVGYLLLTGLLAGIGADFPLVAMCPLAVPSLGLTTVSVAGRPCPAWLPSLAAVLYLTAWCVDVTVLRARLLRDRRASARPRVWFAATTLLLGLGALSAGATHATEWARLMTGLLAGLTGLWCLGAALLVTADRQPDESADPRWWTIWRANPASGPAAVAVLALVPVALAAWPAARCGPEAVFFWRLVVATALVAATLTLAYGTLARWLNLCLERRWPTLVTLAAGLGVVSLTTVSVFGAAQERLDPPAIVALTVACPPLALVPPHPASFRNLPNHLGGPPAALVAPRTAAALLGVGLWYLLGRIVLALVRRPYAPGTSARSARTTGAS